MHTEYEPYTMYTSKLTAIVAVCGQMHRQEDGLNNKPRSVDPGHTNNSISTVKARLKTSPKVYLAVKTTSSHTDFYFALYFNSIMRTYHLIPTFFTLSVGFITEVVQYFCCNQGLFRVHMCVCPNVEISLYSVVCIVSLYIHVECPVSCFVQMRVAENWFVRCMSDCENGSKVTFPRE